MRPNLPGSLCADVRFQTISFRKLSLPNTVIHHHLQIVARCWITVEVDAAGVFQDASHLQ